ncbi:Alpha/Beta hydrolase protein [Neohortaea acidophila]|uniref:Alpha/Beta hydrolase protein n=1 Tax=Neohortaea acidophila TaxID=245834 RepID=A0A6A6PNV4_9PEZI|nr:Alpha/Beta hydrolase protein [Neohortaea acidophila]KAF2481692.1 Alpha/Beta hydrolase protein [Neohortaea acidophila]
MATATRRISPKEQPENPFAQLIPDQEIAIVPSFELESGVVLQDFPVAYKTYGTLSPQRDNAMVIFHALTGSADVNDWWGPLLGGPGDDKSPRKAFDMSRFYVVCVNSPGSPYGSVSPVTARDGNPENEQYGPEFPLTTCRDDVRITKLILDDLGVRQVATVIGGSMGGMLVLEFAYFGKDYVRTVIPIACSARYSAWGISWGEAQRQAIYSDPKYEDGYYAYDDPPATGLGAARMQAMLTYRSRDSFETKFGRNIPDLSKKQTINAPARPHTPENAHFAIHNEGHKNAGSPRFGRSSIDGAITTVRDPQFNGAKDLPVDTTAQQQQQQPKRKITTYYSAQSYLRYQGDKFIKRFDANCYIAITRKLDTHDVTRNRTDTSGYPSQEDVSAALALIEQPTLILGIKSDGLFTFAEQQELAAGIPNSELKVIESADGHDAFLLEFRQVNGFILEFLDRELGDIMAREPVNWPPKAEDADAAGKEVKASTFGEAEVEDITAW